MSDLHSYATFLQRLLLDQVVVAAPLTDLARLEHMLTQPAFAFPYLFTAHVDALLETWPDGATLRPESIPPTPLWLGAVLYQIAWLHDHPDEDLITFTERMIAALPVAEDLPTQIGYHCLIWAWMRAQRGIIADHLQPLLRDLLARSPLSAVWFLHLEVLPSPQMLSSLLVYTPVRAALRDHWLNLGLRPAEVRRGLRPERVAASAAVGTLLGQLLALDVVWQPWVLDFYEVECMLSRQGNDERPQWPLLEQLRLARVHGDARQRRLVERAMKRYRPLHTIMKSEAASLRPYIYLDVRFLEQIARLYAKSTP
ncbi:hypothetical protein [Candidatus Oscillochloris fontis]|uniref:hypothetical protein n=1 Tax=Candidatus Oscillochloris fontis TaxID=2496868 RepID=UPI00101CAB75|nr:hypothetical protein [Candidatus Oscillochloris fontis]